MTNTINKAAPSLGKDLTAAILASLPVEGDPINLDGTYYSGGNIILLNYAKESYGYSTNQWGTYRQCLASNLQVRKGEKSHSIRYVKYDGDDTVIRYYSVFNIAQCDKIEGGV